ncbi:G5 domain-containing protein [Facklamia languida]
MDKQYRYTLRKTTLGLASVAIAAFLAGQVPAVYAADEESTAIVGGTLPPVDKAEENPIEPVTTANPEDSIDPATTANLEDAVEPDAPSILDHSGEEDVTERAETITTYSTTPDASSDESAGLELSEKPQPARQMVEARPEPNYAEDEKKVGEYRDTQLTRGEGPTFSTRGPSMDFKDGFRYKTLEPGSDSPDKTKWGIEIEFDKEKGQRTYTDFSFTNSGNMSTYLNTGSVPANKVGEKISEVGGFKDANYKAESLINIDGTRIQRNLNLYATVKDLEHINSIENENTTIGWKGNYSKDASNQTNKATQGESSSFSFTVNPWPNENDQLSLITLTGSHNEKVYVNGQTVTTGVTVSNLDDSARKRLVGQVYHPETGQVVPGASAHINDQDKVVIEMPKGAVNDDGSVNKDSIFYKDKSYTGLQNLRVKFFARPRTADEFQAATGEYGVYISTGAGAETISHKGKEVVIDKQGIARYDHYNLIGEFSLNLDDTKYHDQDYIDEEGVKTSTSEVSYVRAGIPYIIKNNTQESTDDISDAVGRKHASASLDTSFLDRYNQGKEPEDQWKIEGNDSLTEIKITPPKSAKALDYMPFSIRYTYTNGSVDVHKVSLIVKESGNNIPQYYSQVLYPTETETSQPHLSIKAEDQDKRRPFEYTIEKDTYTDDHGNEWTAKIDPKSGIVTVKPKFAKDFIGGEKLVVPVTAHYVEEKNPEIKFTEEVRAAFVIKQKENLPPRYDAKNGKAGETLTSTPIVKQDGGIDTRTPASYSIAGTEYTDNKGNTWTVSINKKTGVVTANIPNIKDRDKLDGTIISVPVTAHYVEDGQDVGTQEASAQFLASGTNNKIEHTEEIPFKVIVQENKELAKGEWRYLKVAGVEQRGQAGEIKTTWTIENSKVVGEPNTETIKEPKPAIIEVGSKDFTGNVTHEETEEVPFTVKIVEDQTMAPGTYKVVTEGQAGLKTIRYTQAIKNGAADGELKSEEIVTGTTKAPVEEVIRVGTAPVNSKNTAISGDVPVDITYTFDPTKERGTAEKGAFTPGKVETTITNEYNPETGKIETTTTEKITNAKQEIIVGTKDYTGTFEHKETELTPFKTEIVHDPTLKAGEKVTDQVGVNGVKERTITQKFTNGNIADKSYSDWTTVSEVQNEIIKVGSFTEGTQKHEEAIPFDYKVEYDSSIPAGEYRITQEGKDGKRTTEWTIENSKVVGDPKVSEEAPVDAIIKVGNKDFTGLATHTEEFTIPYKVEIRENPDLPVGTRNTVQEGADGSYTITYKQDIKNGDTVGELTKERTDLTPVQNQIIEIGTKQVDPVSENFNYEVQPEIDYVYDDTLPKGTVEKGKTTPGEVKTVITTTRDPQTGELVTKEEKIVSPARQEIRVGTKDYTGEVKYTERVYEDYETTIIQDDTLAADEQVVVTSGVVGIKEREVIRTITNGTPSDPSYGEYKEVTKKQDQVIRVGTKTDGTHSFTEELPFEYTINEVDTLEKGKYEIVTEGKKGTRTTEYKIENSKVVEGSAKVTEETQPTNAVINVGTGTLEGAHTITETEVVPFETIVEFDPNLKAGEQRVEKEGSNGSKEREVTLTIEDGKVVGTQTGEYKETQAPVNKVIKVGSKTEGELVHEEKIPFSYEITYDPTLKAGEVVTDVEGVEGSKKTTWTITNSEAKVTGSEITNPTNAKIRVGTKDYTGTIMHTEEEDIPFKVIVRENPEMLLGTSKTVTEGQAGTKEVTYNIPVKNGAQDPEGEITSSEEVKKNAVDQVIEVGTKPVEAVEKDVSAEVSVEVEIKNDPELDLGKTRTGELVPGKVENVVTTVYNPATGKMETREDKKVTPAKQIVYVGTKDLVGTQEFTVTQPVPFETEYIDDPNLEAGKTEVERQGQPGQKTVTYKAEAKNGQVTSHKATEEITKEPVKQIIRVGTKSEKTNTEVVKENIPFEIEYEYTEELEAGKIEVKQEGELGEKTTTTTTTIVNGAESTDKKEETTKEPVKRIVRVGTKIDRQTTDVTGSETTIIPYKTTVIYDPSLKAGEKVVDKAGENGERKITVTVPVKDGIAGAPVVKTEDIKKAVDEVIRVGTRDDSSDYVSNTNIITENIPFEIRYEEDPDLPVGETRVETPGEFGSKTTTTSTTIVNGETKVNTDQKVTKDPVTQVVKVGTKLKEIPAQNLEETKKEEIPYTTIIQYNDKMDVGSSFVVQEGENGETTITTKVSVENGVAKNPEITTSTTKEAKPRIIQVGTRELKKEVKSEVAYETEVIFDDTLPAGEKRVESGVVGEKTTTITHKLVDNQVVSETSTEITKEAKKEIIRVGTKTNLVDTKDVTKTIEVELAYGTEIIYDDTMPSGEEKVVQEGEVGKREITVTVPVKDGIAGDAVISKDEVVTKAKPKVIKVGTLCPVPEEPEKPADKDIVSTTTVEIPFETEITYDPSLEVGKVIEDQKGVTGERTITTTVRIKDGVTGEPVTENKVTREPVTRKIRIGKKKPEAPAP